MTTSAFGAVRLGYLVVETRRWTDWRRFAADALGLHVDEPARDVMRLRLDDHACRFLLQRGPAEDVTALGFEVDEDTLDLVLGRVADHGLPLREGTADDCALRGVERLWRFPGPNGSATEVFTRATTSEAPLRMVTSGFVTGAAGLGHVALTTRHPQQVRGFYAGVFDARLSDWITEKIAGMALRIRFLRLNERHHSVAVAGVTPLRMNPVRTSIQHVNTQVRTLEDMLGAYERVLEHGFGMQWSVGQHTNDRELSFYCVTPSGFEWEVGWDPLVVTPELEQHWEPRGYDAISIWGHGQVRSAVVERLGQAVHGARSLAQADAGLGRWGSDAR